MLFLSLKWLCKGTKMSCSASGSTFACFDKSEASMLYVRRFKTVGKQSPNDRFWQKSAPCQKWQSRISLSGQILRWCLHSDREVVGRDEGRHLGKDVPWVTGWPGPPVRRCQDARVSSAAPAGAEDRVLPWQPLAGTPTSAGGCQFAGAEDKAQLCLSQNQLSFAKDRFRLTCEGSGLGPAFACAFWGRLRSLGDAKVPLCFVFPLQNRVFLLCWKGGS